ncbi:hypothetical protein SAMN05216553_101540 [Lentzea fradiae]|uniref:Uncharacterized protein n=1 Tax=Lentzea fradiae TaxID=200378 RepID=A0A1G7KXJ5_9PSEU|nr:hypothetical protein [Lentzea fradiae]SDF41821.1 hypothetical protein SAMN05216553_101540 [Lentzea fradiae]
MRRINERFDNVAHLHDLDPRYDWENDDVRDRVEFGENPQREWVLFGTRGRQAPRQQASRQRIPRQQAPRQRKEGWVEAVHNWMKRNPHSSYRTCAAALTGMGYAGITRAKVASVLNEQPPKPTAKSQPKSADKKPLKPAAKKPLKAAKKAKPRTVPQYRPYVPRPRPPEPPLVKIRYCDGCGLAVSDSGACRC